MRSTSSGVSLDGSQRAMISRLIDTKPSSCNCLPFFESNRQVISNGRHDELKVISGLLLSDSDMLMEEYELLRMMIWFEFLGSTHGPTRVGSSAAAFLPFRVPFASGADDDRPPMLDRTPISS